MITSELKKERIKFVIKSFEDRTFNGIYKPERGMGQILVYEKDVKKVKKIIEGLIQP